MALRSSSRACAVGGAGEADAPGGPPGVAPGVQLGQERAAEDQGLQEPQGRGPEGQAAAHLLGVRGQGGQPGQGPLPAQGHRVGLHQAGVGQEEPGPGGGQAVPAVQVAGQGAQGPLPVLAGAGAGQAEQKTPVQGTILEDGPGHSVTLFMGDTS